MFLYKQVPAERLSGLSGNHASRGVWGSALRAKSRYVFYKQVPAERLSGLS